MKSLNSITKAIKEFLRQMILFFESFDYSAIFPEGKKFLFQEYKSINKRITFVCIEHTIYN